MTDVRSARSVDLQAPHAGHVVDVLVAPAGQVADEHLALPEARRLLDHLGDGVGALQGRDDAFQSAQQVKRIECFAVVDGAVGGPAAIIEERVFGAYPG